MVVMDVHGVWPPEPTQPPLRTHLEPRLGCLGLSENRRFSGCLSPTISAARTETVMAAIMETSVASEPAETWAIRQICRTGPHLGSFSFMQSNEPKCAQ